jgi:glycosyltransferase involved in cell wall biosynthesis
MPVRNGERYLRQSLDSLLSQTHGDLEIVIADNASTDATEEICRSYAQRDERVRYVRNRQDYGVVNNFNTVFRLSRGRYFKWAGHDDVCEPEFLARCVAVLEADPSVVLACSRIDAIDESGEKVPYESHPGPTLRPERDRHVNMDAALSPAADDPVQRWRWIMQSLWWTPMLYGVIRSDVLARTPLHPAHWMGDHILLAELVLEGRFHELPEVLLHRRLHGAQTSQRKSARDRLAVVRPDRARSRLAPLYLLWSYPERFLAHVSSVRRAPLTPEQRRACYVELGLTVGRWGRARAKRLLGGP